MSSSLSSMYIVQARPHWWSELTQLADWPCARALLKAGNSIPARMPMMAITTSNSINVKPRIPEFIFLNFMRPSDSVENVHGLSQTGDGMVTWWQKVCDDYRLGALPVRSEEFHLRTQRAMKRCRGKLRPVFRNAGPATGDRKHLRHLLGEDPLSLHARAESGIVQFAVADRANLREHFFFALGQMAFQ